MNLQQELKKLDELRSALFDKIEDERHDTDAQIRALEDAQPKIEFGSPEHAALLASGYGMTIEEARQILKERAKDPRLYPFEVEQKCRAMIAAFEAKPLKVPFNTKQPWRVRPRGKTVTMLR